ncbi:hypothetical protein G7Y89_g8137 [Cudoniella acicularis]|uniref:Uncharacterized protein n=1 Tax=Cudoniella acicularis TaxID=354080 RepID=A0A8H4RH68_9HELO|nr:hypothetical protein G7Y89_g8137 [Cudoniella acicularis]
MPSLVNSKGSFPSGIRYIREEKFCRSTKAKVNAHKLATADAVHAPYADDLLHYKIRDSRKSIAFEEWQPSFTYNANLAALKPAHSSLPGGTHWYYSSCRLSGVVEITPCCEREKDGGPTIGMLLRYRDNRHECVGQYRLDWTTQPLQVSSKYLKNDEPAGRHHSLSTTITTTHTWIRHT